MARRDKIEALTAVNAEIRQAARASVSHEEEWEFFCECGRADCATRVRLTIQAYEALHEAGRIVLADGHRRRRRNRRDKAPSQPGAGATYEAKPSSAASTSRGSVSSS